MYLQQAVLFGGIVVLVIQRSSTPDDLDEEYSLGSHRSPDVATPMSGMDLEISRIHAKNRNSHPTGCRVWFVTRPGPLAL